ncbi:ABC transporter permease [candidate division WOR-3 bacterium]|nr:ABC transporter permease [candidate division WOR-3 bacterium]
MLARLAWRNTFRHTRRTLITALAIAAGITFLILFDTLYGGMKAQSVRLILDYENSKLVLLPEGNFSDYRFNPVDNLIEDSRVVVSRLDQNPHVSTAVPRLRFNATVNVAGNELIAMGIGIDPELDPEVFRLDTEIAEGSFLETEGDFVIGSGLAGDLGVAVGDLVMVTTKTKRGFWELRQYEVTGIVTTSNVLINNNTFLITLKDAQNLIEASGAVSEINISVPGNPKDTERLKEISDGLLADVDGNYEIYTWQEMNAGYFDAFESEQSVAYVLALIIIVIALVGIVNTMLLSIYERIPELGTMRAIGFTASQIRWLLIMEGAVIGFFASLAGVVLGTLTSYPLVRYGIDFTSYTEAIDFNWPFDYHIYGRFSPVNIVFAFLFSWIVSVLASIIPARKATRIEPSQALRSV